MSIQDIVALESGAQGNELRCVVLTDFIRKAEMPQNGGESALFEGIGVVPIFETLRHAELANVRLGVLSGSLVIIPRTAEASLREAAAALGVRPADLSVTREKEKSGGYQLEPRSSGLFQTTGGRDGAAVPETNRFVSAGLREEGQKADNEVGGIAATNYSRGRNASAASEHESRERKSV